MRWEDVMEDIKELCNWVCESEQSSFEDWMEEVGDEEFGHIYQLAEKIRNYFDPSVDIPF